MTSIFVDPRLHNIFIIPCEKGEDGDLSLASLYDVMMTILYGEIRTTSFEDFENFPELVDLLLRVKNFIEPPQENLEIVRVRTSPITPPQNFGDEQQPQSGFLRRVMSFGMGPVENIDE